MSVNAKQELIEACKLVEQYCNVYYREDMVTPEELAEAVYPTPRPETLPITSIKVKSEHSSYILAHTGRFSYQLINLETYNRYTDDQWTDDMIGTYSSINLNKFEELLSDYCTELSLVDTWS